MEARAYVRTASYAPEYNTIIGTETGEDSRSYHYIHVYAAVYVIATDCVAGLRITMSGFDSSDEESGDFNLSQFPIWW